MPVLLSQTNRMSLRTALINDDGNLVHLHLNPTPENLLQFLTTKNSDWVSKDAVWLYRHLRSAEDEIRLMGDFPCVDQDIKPLEFQETPQFKLIWADSGNSVALYLNGEPWAFICMETHQGYSKGMLPSDTGRTWDQELFEKTFLK
jgi:hypothetical protein